MAVALPFTSERKALGSRKVQARCLECGILTPPFTVDLCEVRLGDQVAVMWEGISPFPLGWVVHCQDKLSNVPVATVGGYCPKHNK